MDNGSYVVKCMKPGGDTLVTYGFVAAQDQEVDLLDFATPSNIRAADYGTADNMCCDTGFELAAKIALGDWVVVSTRLPSYLQRWVS